MTDEPLLDTHALLWWLDGSPMEDEVVERISAGTELVTVSAASVWEAGIKAQLGKLELEIDLVEEVATEGFEPLSISLDHIPGPCRASRAATTASSGPV